MPATATRMPLLSFGISVGARVARGGIGGVTGVLASALKGATGVSRPTVVRIDGGRRRRLAAAKAG